MAKQNNNYFTQNVKHLGEDFIINRNSLQLKQDAIRVFRELARGKIDPRNEGKYFLDPQFLQCAIEVCIQKYQLHKISADGVQLMEQQMPVALKSKDSPIYTVLDFHTKLSDAYEIILHQLNNIQRTGDVNHLYSLVSILKPYKSYL